MTEEKINLDDKEQKINYKILAADDILGSKNLEQKKLIKPQEKKNAITGLIKKITNFKFPFKRKTVEPSEKQNLFPSELPKEEVISISQSDQSNVQLNFQQNVEQEKVENIEQKEIKKEELFFQPQNKDILLKSAISNPQPLIQPQSNQLSKLEKNNIFKYLIFLIPAVLLILGGVFFIFKNNNQQLSFENNQNLGGKNKDSYSELFLPKPQEVEYVPVVTNLSTQTEQTSTEISSSLTTSSEKITTFSQKETEKQFQISTGISFASSSKLNFPYMSYEEIIIPRLSETIFKEVLQEFLSKQEKFGVKKVVVFLNDNNKISYGYIFNYFFNSQLMNLYNLSANFTGDYELIFYYGYSRKYPIFIFEVNNIESVENFNKKWEESGMANDLKNLFLVSFSDKINKKFVTKNYRNINYRIVELGDNFKIIWSVAKNYLIYSTTETGFKDVVDVIVNTN